MASAAFQSVDMEFWSDWDEDVDIPKPLRIVKRSNTIAGTTIGSSPREISIPRRQSSLSICAFSSPPEGPVGCLTIHKRRKSRPHVVEAMFEQSPQSAENYHVEEDRFRTPFITAANPSQASPTNKFSQGQGSNTKYLFDTFEQSDYPAPLRKSSLLKRVLFSKTTTKPLEKGQGASYTSNTLRDVVNIKSYKSHNSPNKPPRSLTNCHPSPSFRDVVSGSKHEAQENFKHGSKSTNFLYQAFKRMSVSSTFNLKRVTSLYHTAVDPLSSLETDSLLASDASDIAMDHQQNPSSSAGVDDDNSAQPFVISMSGHQTPRLAENDNAHCSGNLPLEPPGTGKNLNGFNGDESPISYDPSPPYAVVCPGILFADVVVTPDFGSVEAFIGSSIWMAVIITGKMQLPPDVHEMTQYMGNSEREDDDTITGSLQRVKVTLKFNNAVCRLEYLKSIDTGCFVYKPRSAKPVIGVPNLRNGESMTCMALVRFLPINIRQGPGYSSAENNAKVDVGNYQTPFVKLESKWVNGLFPTTADGPRHVMTSEQLERIKRHQPSSTLDPDHDPRPYPQVLDCLGMAVQGTALSLMQQFPGSIPYNLRRLGVRTYRKLSPLYEVELLPVDDPAFELSAPYSEASDTEEADRGSDTGETAGSVESWGSGVSQAETAGGDAAEFADVASEASFSADDDGIDTAEILVARAVTLRRFVAPRPITISYARLHRNHGCTNLGAHLGVVEGEGEGPAAE